MKKSLSVGERAYQHALRRRKDIESEMAEIDLFLRLYEKFSGAEEAKPPLLLLTSRSQLTSLVDFDSLDELVQGLPDEPTCIDQLQAVRWPQGAFCPYCGERHIYHFSDAGIYKCAHCLRHFSVRVGTIFEGSKLPLQKWLVAVWMILRCEKVASTALARTIGVTQKTAWWMLQKLRQAKETGSLEVPKSVT